MSCLENYECSIDDLSVMKKESLFHQAIRMKDNTRIRNLLDQREDANFTNDREQTPLHYALKYSNHEIVEILIKHGVDLEKQDNQNFTALGYAIQTGAVGSLELLLQYGANVNQEQGIEKKMPLLLVIEKFDYRLAQMLIHFGANMYVDYLYNFYFSRKELCDVFLTYEFKLGIDNSNWPEDFLYDVCRYTALRRIKQKDHVDLKNEYYYKECIKELEKMKTIYLDERITSYHYVKASRNQLINYSKNKNLCVILKRFLLDDKFKIYKNILKINIVIGDRYAPLYDKVSFDDPSGRYSLPILIRDNVLKYLNERDINNFIRARNLR